jgi:CotH kinase protein/Lamin Tail Domain/Secretion system C-terminal sorting domain
MNRFLLTYWGLSLAFTSFAQNYPKEVRLDADQHRLIRGGQPDDGGLFDQTVIHEVEFIFAESNYWNLLTQNYQSKTDLAGYLVFDGDTLPAQVGIRFKGQTSYQMAQNTEKKSFNVSVDYADANQAIMGYQTLNFNNCFGDNTFMREYLYGFLSRPNIPAPKVSFIHLTINGEDWGVYPNVQQLNKKYVGQWQWSTDGTLWRADVATSGPGGGGGGPQWGDGTAALNDLGSDTTSYQEYYTLKYSTITNPWDALVTTCQAVDGLPIATLDSTLADFMDTDEMLWFLASEIAFCDDDGYAHKGKMDYYHYYDAATGRVVMLEFDGNSAMETGATTWSPFYNANDVNYPLLNRVMQNPDLRQRYLAHFRTVLQNTIDTVAFNDYVAETDALIGDLVASDPKKIYTTAQYISGQTTLKTWMKSRVNYLAANAEILQVAPTIASASMSANGVAWAEPAPNQSVQVVANVTSANGIFAVYLYYCTALDGKFTKIAMFDDGAHNDGAASDGQYGVDIPGQISGTPVRFYVEAISSNTQKSRSYLPVGAEHDVYFYSVGAMMADVRPVVINEIVPDNEFGTADAAGEFEDWIELYNVSSESVDLSGWHLTDNPLNFTKYAFPDGFILAPGAYEIVWCDEDGALQGDWHANFKLSKSGETIYLLNPAGQLVDTVTYGDFTEDLGYARMPNGTGTFVAQNPTFSFNNETVGQDDIYTSPVVLVPNPAHSMIEIKSATTTYGAAVQICNTLGQVLLTDSARADLRVDISTWPGGIYFVNVGNQAARLVVCR